MLGGSRTIFKQETAIGEVWVTEYRGRRQLHIDNSVVQGAMELKDINKLVVIYTRCMANFVHILPSANNILHLGLGAGSVVRYINHYLPHIKQTVVEIEPTIVDVCRDFFHLPQSQNICVVTADAGSYIEEDHAPYDVILIDAFTGGGIADFVLADNFGLRLRQRLSDKGMAVINVWSNPPTTYRILVDNMLRNFPYLYYEKAQTLGNRVLFPCIEKPHYIYDSLIEIIPRQNSFFQKQL